ncbi:MAG: pirin, partial [Spirosoma sp.]|nr:pirin [Spirosoma sp.]
MKDTPVEAQIYLAEGRGCTETMLQRSYHPFNFGDYQAEGREPFGALQLLNDDTLRAGAHLTMRVEKPMTVMLLPVTGGLEYKCPLASGFLEPGQVSLLSMAAGMNYTISNPYDTES